MKKLALLLVLLSTPLSAQVDLCAVTNAASAELTDEILVCRPGTPNVSRLISVAELFDSAILSTLVNLPSVTAFPGSPSAGDVVVVTDDSAIGACDSAAGSARSLCRYNGSVWQSLGDGGGGGGISYAEAAAAVLAGM